MSQTNQKISVFVHPRVFWSGRFGGVSRYICELSHELIKSGVDVQIPICDTPNEYFLKSPLHSRAKELIYPAPWWVRCLRYLLKFTRLSEKARRGELYFQGLRYTKRAEYDLVHPSYTYSTEILKHIKDKPLVVTIHDMIDEIYYPDDPGHQITSNRKRQFTKQAEAIIAISEQTKADLIRLFNIPASKIEVIYHGNSLKLPVEHAEMQVSLPERYVLFVGTRLDYKNFSTLAKAFASLSKKDPNLHLVCAGGGAFTHEEILFLNDLGISSRTEQRSVNDTELAIMYNRSQCFVFPSEYEGFGMPILEAFECGAPVICADSSCFPEIAQNGALYFTKDDADELSKCIASVIYSPAEQNRLRMAGKVRLADFSWEKAAKQTLAVYSRVMQGRNR